MTTQKLSKLIDLMEKMTDVIIPQFEDEKAETTAEKVEWCIESILDSYNGFDRCFNALEVLEVDARAIILEFLPFCNIPSYGDTFNRIAREIEVCLYTQDYINIALLGIEQWAKQEDDNRLLCVMACAVLQILIADDDILKDIERELTCKA